MQTRFSDKGRASRSTAESDEHLVSKLNIATAYSDLPAQRLGAKPAASLVTVVPVCTRPQQRRDHQTRCKHRLAGDT